MSAKKREDISEAVSHLLEECRMVLPGIQALFGFQLIAAFNQRFTELSYAHQCLHLAAISLIALCAAIVMTPAAYHRSVEPQVVSERFLKICTRFILVSMLLLAIGVSADLYIIAVLIVDNRAVCMALAAAVFVSMLFLWFAFPLWERK
jgi:hypothetical protein